MLIAFKKKRWWATAKNEWTVSSLLSYRLALQSNMDLDHITWDLAKWIEKKEKNVMSDSEEQANFSSLISIKRFWF